MAQTTMNLSITKSGYVKSASPTTVFPTNANTNYIVTNDIGTLDQNRLYFGFEGVSDSLKHNIIYGMQVQLYLRPGYDDLQVNWCYDFDPSTLTWRTKPAGTDNVAEFEGAKTSAPGSWGNKTAQLYDASRAALLLDTLSFWVGVTGVWSQEKDNWYAKIVLANGTTPYLTLTYDDTAKIVSGAEWVNTSKTKGWITDNTAYSGKTYDLSWDLSRASGQSGHCIRDYDGWEQASASFCYRVQGATTWTKVAISGSEMSWTIPASTFPTGQTIEYCVEVTDTEGTTSQTVTKTIPVAASQITAQNAPISGYNNPRTATSFGWYFKTGNYNVESGNVTLYWRETGASSWTSVSTTSGSESVTVAANTFPVGSSVEWYLSGSDFSGATSQTEVYTFSTSAGTAYAQCVSPISSVEDGSAPITFTWTLSSTDGQTPSGVDFWWKLPSEANNQWHAILSNASPVTSYTVPGGTFPAGEIQWLTRAYNADGTAGPFSTPGYGYYSFICVAAPNPVEGLNATAVPLTTISWQSDEQQAYMITIDGVVVRKAFGNDVASWQVEEPLSEGVHEIAVSVQGQYGFWSEPAAISIAVGGPTDELDLSGEFSVDAVLSTDSTGMIRYYRDGVFIGTATDDAPFTDNRALGTHEYFSRILLNDGNYKQSNTVTGEMSVTTKMIAALDGSSGWLELKLSENSMDVDEYRLQQDQVLQHIKGAVWPRGDRSSFRDKYATYNCAFVTKEDATAFEALFGKLVILKGKGEELVIGMLNQVQKRINVFYTSYTFTIQQVYVSEIIT